MTNIDDQYRIITNRAGWIDRSELGRLQFDGKDRQAFLQALVSNEVDALLANHGVYATYLTPQGRMICDLRIYNRGAHLLAVVAAGLATSLAARLDQLIFAEDVTVRDVSAEIAQLTVMGAAAAAVLERAFGIDVDALAPLAQAATAKAVVARADEADVPMFDVFVPASSRDETLAAIQSAGAEPIGPEIVDLLRIEAGRPAFGVDMTSETIPLEAGLQDRGISTEKGCYVGQEVIIRVLHRGGGRVVKRLVTLVFAAEAKAPAAAGTMITAEDRDIGVLTSAAWSPRRERVVALGYVRRDQAEVGRHVHAGGHDAEVTGWAR